MDLPARFLNHSCGPNIGVGKRRRSKEEEEESSSSNMNMNEKGSYDFVALRDLDEGEVRLLGEKFQSSYELVPLDYQANHILHHITGGSI